MEKKFDLKFYKSIVDQTHSNIYITDIETDEIIYMNDFMKKEFQLSEPEGKKCWEVLQKDEHERCSFCKIKQLLQNNESCLWKQYNSLNGKVYMNYDILENWNGKYYHVQYSTDITDTLQLSEDASIDELTMLLNRKAGKKRLSETLETLETQEQLIIGLYDINGLKWVNDTFGHHEGDHLLHYAATKMQDRLDEPDFMFRLSGDEFIIVFVNKELYEAEKWMQDVLLVLREDREKAGIEYEVSFSYGLVKVRGRDYLSLSDALGLADTRMYLQKREYHIEQQKMRMHSEEKIENRKKFKYNKDSIFEALSETVDGYVFAGNLKTGEFMYSSQMVREFGLPRQIITNAAAFWGERIHPDDRELFLRSNQEIADGVAERHTIVYRAKNARGKWIRLLCKGKMIRDAEGKPDLFAGVIRNLDNLELRRNLSLSAQSSFYFISEMEENNRGEIEEELFEFVNRNLPGGIIATSADPDLSIVCFNQTLIEYMDYTHEEFLKRTRGRFREFIYEEDREKVLDEIERQLQEKEVYEVYYRIIKKDGSFAWIYDVGRYKINENGERYILSFLVDATNEIEKGKELSFINEASTSGIFKGVLTDHFELIYANDGFYKIYGHTREADEEKFKHKFFDILGEEEQKKIIKGIRDAAAAGKEHLVLEYRIRNKNDSCRWVHMDCSIMQQEGGNIVLIGVIVDITERHMLEERIRQTEQIYQFIGNYKKLDVWEYNLQEDTVVIHDLKDGVYQNGRVYKNMPESLIRVGGVHPDSIGECYDLYNRICRGEENIVAVIQFCREGTKSLWKRIISETVKEEDGSIRGAIGIIEDVTVQKEAEIRTFDQEKMREILTKDMMYSVHINMTKNQLEAIWKENGVPELENVREASYREVYEAISRRIASEDDRKRFREEFNPNEMQQCASQDGYAKKIDFRQVAENGQIIWVSLSFRIIDSPTTGNKILFINARNIDAVKRRALSLQKKAETDEITGLYNMATEKLLIESVLNDRTKKAGESVFALINIDNFREINRIGGFAAGDGILHQIGGTITKIAPTFCISGRIMGDMFAVYLYNRRIRKEIEQEIRELTEKLRGDYTCGNRKFRVTLSCGAICPGERKVTYDFLYQNASDALDAAKKRGGNQFVFYSEIAGMASDPEIYGQEMEQILGKCLEWAKKGETKKEVYRILLENVGRFYDAEEVTLFRKISPDRCIKVVGWNAHRKGATLPIETENICFLFEILKDVPTGRGVYVSAEDAERGAYIRKAYGAAQVDYPVLAMGEREKDGLEYIILLEKGEIRIRDAVTRRVVLEMIRWIEYLYRSRDAYEEALQSDRNTGVLNYESFVSRLQNMNGDMISALGMAGVQMVDLKKYNQQYGMEKGDESLLFAADCMRDIFGRSNCYRVGRTSFCAVCEDMAYKQFTERCRQLEKRLEDGYGELMITASVWEHVSISAGKMWEQMEEKLAVARNKKKNSSMISKKAVQEIHENIQTLMDTGRFRVFLQPKADTNTEKICGAEALIRLYDEKGAVVPPGRFLPAIEQAGLICKIDIFVLKEVCRIMKEWREEGWEPFPISLNYSRMTVLEPGILEETNRIVEAFSIPKELIEIEITESIGSIDNMSLKNIVERFADSGYRIALDDYGAEYSNVYILYSLRLNTLKLDRRIVNDLYHDMKARTIVESVIDVCRKFQIECVAEGVETKEQLEVLKEMCCDVVQGYYLNKPLPEEEFHQYYIERKEV